LLENQLTYYPLARIELCFFFLLKGGKSNAHHQTKQIEDETTESNGGEFIK
jgi:hypothetical protein